MCLAWNSTLHSGFPSPSAPASLWLHSIQSDALDFITIWPQSLACQLGRTDSTALFPSRPQAARANPNQRKTHQKEGRHITEQRNRVLSRPFPWQLPICSLDIDLDTVPQEGFYEALEFCVSAIGSALPPANNWDLVNSGSPEEVNECFVSFKRFQTQPLQRAESSLIIKKITSEEQAILPLSRPFRWLNPCFPESSPLGLT